MACGDDDVAINSYNNIAILVRYSKLPQVFIDSAFANYDFTLQIIAAGGTTIRFRNLSTQCLLWRSQTADDEYYAKQQADIKNQNQQFIAMWPSVSRR